MQGITCADFCTLWDMVCRNSDLKEFILTKFGPAHSCIVATSALAAAQPLC